MEEILVRTGGGQYPVYVGHHLYEGALSDELARLDPRAVVLVSHPTITAMHGERILAVLGGTSEERRRTVSFLFPQGESNKTLATLEAGCTAMLEAGVTREDLVVAFGGGVVGDVAGFIAATYMRGVRYLQVPTTLMAMVDSSIGGKVGVDLPGAKNAVGAFHQPLAVFCDSGVLDTLPAREVSGGLAEVAKYGFLYDAELLGKVEALSALSGLTGDGVEAVIARCAELKACVVGEDERDARGVRAMLNYGHTFGHAMESSAGFGVLLHGEAVAAGMMMAARLSELTGLADRGLYELHRGILLPLLAKIPTEVGFEVNALLTHMQSDKKKGERVRFVLLERPQAPRLVDDVPQRLVEKAVMDTIYDMRSEER